MENNQVSAMDVAKLANVSQSTVSRAFTPNASISKKAKDKVMKAAKELNYYPNALARGLINQKSKIIGIAMKNVQNPFYFEVLNKFSTKLEKLGFSVLYISTDKENLVADQIKKFLEFNVDGIIVTSAFLNAETENILRSNTPVVLFNRYDESLPYHSVSSENLNAVEQIGELILSTGIRQGIYYIAGQKETSTNQERQNHFTQYLTKKDVSVEIIQADYTYETAFNKVNDLLANDEVPKAIFAANDIMALGVLDALKKNNVRVPEETIVIGYDDIKMASWPNYQLTTWKQPIEEMIDVTIELLLNNSEFEEPQRRKIDGSLIKRITTR